MGKSSDKSVSVRRIEIVSRLKDDNGNVLFDMDKLPGVLKEKEKIIRDYCYIIHDKDVYEETTEKHQEGDLKPAHIHLLLRFKEDQPQKIKYIAKWFGLAENFLSTIKGDWNSACLYQIHFNAEDKYPYDASEVTANFDYPALIEEAKRVKAEMNAPAIDIIISKILSGDIKEYRKTLDIDGRTLVKYSQKIENAFKYYAERQQVTQKERCTEIVFITGKPGCGKTTLARKIAENKGLEYFISSGSNDILDSYSQQPCLILDDIRPSSLGLSDLLKMLDPHVASSVKSRYRNKHLSCKLIVLTTVLSIDTFYKNVFQENDEPVTQLKRRCQTYIKMWEDSIEISVWDKKRRRYTSPVYYKNNVIEKFVPKDTVTEKDVKKHIEELIPFLEEDTFDIDGFHLEPVGEEKIPAQKQETDSNNNDSVSDENFKNIFPNAERED